MHGTLTAEEPLQLGRGTFTGTCSIGAFSYLNGLAEINHADIGRYCSIAPGVVVGAVRHRTDRISTSPRAGGSPEQKSRVAIGHDVWIGTNAVVMPDIAIETGAVIGAGSVVTHDVPPYAIVGGVPARIIRFRFDEATIWRLRQSGWFCYDVTALPDFDLPAVLDAIAAGKLPVLDPPKTRLTG